MHSPFDFTRVQHATIVRKINERTDLFPVGYLTEALQHTWMKTGTLINRSDVGRQRSRSISSTRGIFVFDSAYQNTESSKLHNEKVYHTSDCATFDQESIFPERYDAAGDGNHGNLNDGDNLEEEEERFLGFVREESECKTQKLWCYFNQLAIKNQ